jgi:hypothetical protein
MRVSHGRMVDEFQTCVVQLEMHKLESINNTGDPIGQTSTCWRGDFSARPYPVA